VRTDIDVMRELAERLGVGSSFAFHSPREAFDELRVATSGARADYAGITYERIRRERGVFWPCPDVGHPGTPRLFADRFAHPNGLARFRPVVYRPAAELPDAHYPLYFTTGRYREHYNSGAQTRRVGPLLDAQPQPRLEMNRGSPRSSALSRATPCSSRAAAVRSSSRCRCRTASASTRSSRRFTGEASARRTC